jgi:hypothetical protein
MLLLRALVARFWEQPYPNRELVRWGTRIHDRFMLPHYVWTDFQDAIAELNQAGLSLRERLVPAVLRVPLPVLRRHRPARHRTGIAPGHGTLARDGRRTGAGRDRALRRFLGGADAGQGARHGRRAARGGLQRPAGAAAPTGVPGEFVAGRSLPGLVAAVGAASDHSGSRAAGVRLVDTWNQRSIGGCTYHVMHPGGRNPDTFPVNANEAEARRFARFWPYGHTPGPMVGAGRLDPVPLRAPATPWKTASPWPAPCPTCTGRPRSSAWPVFCRPSCAAWRRCAPTSASSLT